MQERRVEPALTTSAARHRLVAVLPVAIAVVVVDQLTKWWALEQLESRVVDLVWTLRLRLVFNTGAAFSLGGGLAPFLALAALVVVVLLVLRSERFLTGTLPHVAVGLVIGGAVGNLTDRALRGSGGLLSGAVVDFIDVQWWPVFNVADIAISCGAVLLAVTAARAPVPADDEEPGAGPQPSATEGGA